MSFQVGRLGWLVLFTAGMAFASAIPPTQEPCPFLQPEGTELVEDSYIVFLKDGHTFEDHFAYIAMNLTTEAQDFADISIRNTTIYHAILENDVVHQRVRYDPGVDFVQQTTQLAAPDSITYDDPDSKASSYNETQEAGHELHYELRRRGTNPPYHILREPKSIWWQAQITAGKKIDSSLYEADSWYMSTAGEGVDVYVLDSGIRADHEWFGGRVSNFRGLTTSPFTGSLMEDRDGHGTHVASIIAKLAPRANIINVKTSCFRANKGNEEPNCVSNSKSLAYALSEIAEDHKANIARPPRKNWRGSVINISGGNPGEIDRYIAMGVQAATWAGIPIAAAAGNLNLDKTDQPCNTMTMCVGASNRKYERWRWNDDSGSNYGYRIKIVAPGEYIKGASHETQTKNVTKSGTSQATPMVAAAMAIIVGYEGLNNNTAAVYDRIKQNALLNAVTGFASNLEGRFLNTGINAKGKGKHPYLGVPSDSHNELKVREGKRTLTPATAISSALLPTWEATNTTYSEPTYVPGNPTGNVAESLFAGVLTDAAPGYAIISTVTVGDATVPAEYVVTQTYKDVAGTTDTNYNPKTDILVFSADSVADVTGLASLSAEVATMTPPGSVASVTISANLAQKAKVGNSLVSKSGGSTVKPTTTSAVKAASSLVSTISTTAKPTAVSSTKKVASSTSRAK